MIATYTVMMSAMVGELLVVGLVDLLSKCAVRQCQVCVGQSIIQKGEGQIHLAPYRFLKIGGRRPPGQPSYTRPC